MIARFIRGRAFAFALVLGWKTALFLLSTQPIPANDSFFYDGAVVNYVLHGHYVNPSLALALPISSTEVFSAYPPLYQAVLLPWVMVCGTSVQAVMIFHLLWFGGYVLILFEILKLLNPPVWCFRLAGAFLFVITFHDRPDSVAQVLGMLAVWCWVRSRVSPGSDQTHDRSARWLWPMAGCVVLCFATSLQIGAIYFLLIWAGTLGASLCKREWPPVGPLLAMSLIPPLAIAGVAWKYPHLWAGFLEHAHQTPSLTGLRFPSVDDLFKVGRTTPGIVAAAIILAWTWWKRPGAGKSNPQLFDPVAFACGVAALVLVGASLFLLTPNMVGAAAYLQPVLVCCCLASLAGSAPESVRCWTRIFLGLALLGSIRALGMSTWGVACATDVSCSQAMRIVDDEVTAAGTGRTVVLSSAYLYEAARHADVRWIHSDWLGKASQENPNADRDELLALKPSRLILTQFDYYRRYEAVLAGLKVQAPSAGIEVTNLARVPSPDSFKSFRRVVQHVSWAPVVVRIDWGNIPTAMRN